MFSKHSGIDSTKADSYFHLVRHLLMCRQIHVCGYVKYWRVEHFGNANPAFENMKRTWTNIQWFLKLYFIVTRRNVVFIHNKINVTDTIKDSAEYWVE